MGITAISLKKTALPSRLKTPMRSIIPAPSSGQGVSRIVKKKIGRDEPEVSWHIKYKGVPVVGGGPITEDFPGIYKTKEEIDDSKPISTDDVDLVSTGKSESGVFAETAVLPIVGKVSTLSIILIILTIGVVFYFVKKKGR